MPRLKKWTNSICFGVSAFAFLATSAVFAEAPRTSQLPARLILEAISDLEQQVEAAAPGEESKLPPGSPEGYVEWEPDLLPDSVRSIIYYDLSDEAFEDLENNRDEKGASLL